jgi:hypothetical protein
MVPMGFTKTWVVHLVVASMTVSALLVALRTLVLTFGAVFGVTATVLLAPLVVRRPAARHPGGLE